MLPKGKVIFMELSLPVVPLTTTPPPSISTLIIAFELNPVSLVILAPEFKVIVDKCVVRIEFNFNVLVTVIATLLLGATFD